MSNNAPREPGGATTHPQIVPPAKQRRPGRDTHAMKRVASLFFFFLLTAFVFGAPPEIAAISQKELQAAIKSRSVVILDANGSASYHDGHIPGAIDFVAHKKDIANLLPTDKNSLIVAYCANEYCPHYLIAAQAAIALGYTNVRHFAPGIAGWIKSGEPVKAGWK